jgi:predicted TIM-barrel fold metal-dependent hydrolase
MQVHDVDALRVIDSDTHIVEPYDLWTSRVSVKKYGDRVPHVRWDDARQEDVWHGSGGSLGVGGAQVAAAGWKEAPPKHPARLEDVSPAVWQAEARLALMTEYGIHAQVLYPNVPFAGFGSSDDRQLELLLVKAYNDFLSDFSSADPNRLLPQTLLPFWDIDLAIGEAQRCHENGHRGVIFSQAPQAFGQPLLADRHWDRLWAALQELGMPVNFHIASGGDIEAPFKMLPADVGATAAYAAAPVIFFLDNAKTIALPPLPRPAVRVGRERRRVGAVPRPGARLDVEGDGRARRSPGAGPAAE